MTDETESAQPRRPRNKAQTVLVGLMLLLLVTTQIFSHRPRFLTNRPQVVHIANLPADKVDAMQEFLDHGKGFPNDRYLPPFGLKKKPDYDKPFSQPMLGYSIREVSMLGMPLFAYKQQGLVIFAVNDVSIVTNPIDDATLNGLGEATSKAGHNFVFPIWEYVWGLLLFVLIGAWIWIWWRSDRKYRAESGLL